MNLTTRGCVALALFGPLIAAAVQNHPGVFDIDLERAEVGFYTANFDIDGRKLRVLVDTGSRDFWISQGPSTVLKEGASFSVRYGSGTATGKTQFGPLGIIGGPSGEIGPVTCPYGVASKETGLLQNLKAIEGVWGLSLGGSMESLVHCLWRQNAISEQLVTLSLNDVGGVLRLGSSASRKAVQLLTVGMDKSWTIRLDGVATHSTDKQQAGKLQSVVEGKALALLDSGTSGIRAPPAALAAIATALQATQGRQGELCVPCERLQSLPDIVLRLGAAVGGVAKDGSAGKDAKLGIAISVQKLAVTTVGDSCALQIRSTGALGAWIFGDVFFRQMQSVTLDYGQVAVLLEPIQDVVIPVEAQHAPLQHQVSHSPKKLSSKGNASTSSVSYSSTTDRSSAPPQYQASYSPRKMTSKVNASSTSSSTAADQSSENFSRNFESSNMVSEASDTASDMSQLHEQAEHLQKKIAGQHKEPEQQQKQLLPSFPTYSSSPLLHDTHPLQSKSQNNATLKQPQQVPQLQQQISPTSKSSGAWNVMAGSRSIPTVSWSRPKSETQSEQRTAPWTVADDLGPDASVWAIAEQDAWNDHVDHQRPSTQVPEHGLRTEVSKRSSGTYHAGHLKAASRAEAEKSKPTKSSHVEHEETMPRRPTGLHGPYAHSSHTPSRQMDTWKFTSMRREAADSSAGQNDKADSGWHDDRRQDKASHWLEGGSVDDDEASQAKVASHDVGKGIEQSFQRQWIDAQVPTMPVRVVPVMPAVTVVSPSSLDNEQTSEEGFAGAAAQLAHAAGAFHEAEHTVASGTDSNMDVLDRGLSATIAASQKMPSQSKVRSPSAQPLPMVSPATSKWASDKNDFHLNTLSSSPRLLDAVPSSSARLVDSSGTVFRSKMAGEQPSALAHQDQFASAQPQTMVSSGSWIPDSDKQDFDLKTASSSPRLLDAAAASSVRQDGASSILKSIAEEHHSSDETWDAQTKDLVEKEAQAKRFLGSAGHHFAKLFHNISENSGSNGAQDSVSL